MSESDINWNVMLRKIEREFDGLPPERSAAEARAHREAERLARQRERARVTPAGVAVRLGLVLALAVGLLVWPYARDCGRELWAYLVATAMVAAGGLLAATYTWRGRMGGPHFVAGLLVLWGLALAAVEVVPRVGYPAAGLPRSRSWQCEAATGR